MKTLIKFLLIAGGILIVACIAFAVISAAIQPRTQPNTAQPRAQSSITIQPVAVKSTSASVSPTDAPAQPTEAPTAAPAEEPIKLTGVLVNKCPTSIIYKAQAGKKLVGVRVTLRNDSGSEISVNPLYFSLVDADGFVYAPVLASCDEQIDTTKIGTGQAIRGLVGFEIPPEAKPARIEYKPNLFGGAKIAVDLTN